MKELTSPMPAASRTACLAPLTAAIREATAAAAAARFFATPADAPGHSRRVRRGGAKAK